MLCSTCCCLIHCCAGVQVCQLAYQIQYTSDVLAAAGAALAVLCWSETRPYVSYAHSQSGQQYMLVSSHPEQLVPIKQAERRPGH